MRKFLTMAACAAALTLAACTGRSESYAVPSADAYAKLAGAGYAEGIYPLPTGLLGADVSLSFEAVPTDQTAVWKFTRGGKEVARVNAVVEGDSASSKISYSYAAANGAAGNEKVERQIKQFMPLLIAEAVDARIENRPVDRAMKANADAMTMTAMVGDMMQGASAAMDKAIREQDARDATRLGEAQAGNSKYDSTRPTTDLSKY